MHTAIATSRLSNTASTGANAAASKVLQNGQRDHRAYHHHFAVREVDQAEDAVHHGVAQCHQGIHAALHQAVDDLLKKDFHDYLLGRSIQRKSDTPGVAFHDCKPSHGLAAGAPPMVCTACHLPWRT